MHHLTKDIAPQKSFYMEKKLFIYTHYTVNVFVIISYAACSPNLLNNCRNNLLRDWKMIWSEIFSTQPN